MFCICCDHARQSHIYREWEKEHLLKLCKLKIDSDFQEINCSFVVRYDSVPKVLFNCFNIELYLAMQTFMLKFCNLFQLNETKVFGSQWEHFQRLPIVMLLFSVFVVVFILIFVLAFILLLRSFTNDSWMGHHLSFLPFFFSPHWQNYYLNCSLSFNL